MEVAYKGSRGREVFTISRPEEFYPAVAKKIAAQEQGRRVQVVAGIDNDHYVVYMVAVRSGTQNITPVADTMPESYKNTRMQEKYLACIDRHKNSYKYYHMLPGVDTFTVKYGRCAVEAGQLFGERSCVWDNVMWDAKLEEKLHKGYVDISEYMLAEDTTTLGNSIKKNPAHTPGSELFGILHDCARTTAKRAVNVPINAKLISKSKELIDELRSCAEMNDLDKFNQALCLLMVIMQRNVRTGDGMGVEENMAHSAGDFGSIIRREADLCQVMEGALAGKAVVNGDFSDYGIEVREADDKERSFVLSHLGKSLKGKVARIWHVNPVRQEKRYRKYLEQHQITETRYLWHGSRNENWASIIRKGLLLDPDAVITGKMFGKGIYFAPSSAKSWNYTSYYGTSWANGTSDHAFMGLYQVAYGHPMDVSRFDYMRDYCRDVLNGPYDCCHAHAGQSLHADEIVFYDESAVLLSYIVEFA